MEIIFEMPGIWPWSKEERARRVAQVKSKTAVRGKKAAAKIAQIQKEASASGDLRNMLISLANQV